MAGKDKGKQGEVLRVVRDQRFPRVFVAGVNMVSSGGHRPKQELTDRWTARATACRQGQPPYRRVQQCVDCSAGDNSTTVLTQLLSNVCAVCVLIDCADHSQGAQEDNQGRRTTRLQRQNGGGWVGEVAPPTSILHIATSILQPRWRSSSVLRVCHGAALCHAVLTCFS